MTQIMPQNYSFNLNIFFIKVIKTAGIYGLKGVVNDHSQFVNNRSQYYKLLLTSGGIILQ